MFLLVLVCLCVGFLASAGHVGREILALAMLATVAVALVVPPHLFVALALLVFGSFSISSEHPLGFGGTSVYSTDVLLFIVLLRAALPRERVRPHARLDKIARLCFGLYALVMLLAGVRSALSGTDLVSVVRLETPLIYSVGFYVGLSRIVRERNFKLDGALRNLLAVAFGFVGWMALMYAINQPFETDETAGKLGTVITTSAVLRRDYGLASAFIVYPALALAAAAYLLYAPRRTALAATAATIGVFATLVTFIRSEIFGLFMGLAVITVLRGEATLKRMTRARGIVAASIGLAIGGFGLWAVNPPFAGAIVERSLPGIMEQSETAKSTADYRVRALSFGLASADRHPAGVGLLPAEALYEARIPPGYVAHSAPTALLIYVGWIGLAAAALAVVALVRASFRAVTPLRGCTRSMSAPCSCSSSTGSERPDSSARGGSSA